MEILIRAKHLIFFLSLPLLVSPHFSNDFHFFLITKNSYPQKTSLAPNLQNQILDKIHYDVPFYERERPISINK